MSRFSPWRRGRTLPGETMSRVPDDLPRGAQFDQPVRVDRIVARDAEPLDDGRYRIAFVVYVRDTAEARCPDLAVDATITGPERRGEGTAVTDLLGRATFRMTGPPGTYRFEVLDVAAGALEVDRAASALAAEVDVAV